MNAPINTPFTFDTASTATTTRETKASMSTSTEPHKKHRGNMKKVQRSVKKVVKKITSDNHSYRWEELQRIERRRRNILLNVEEPTWKVLMHWDGTVLRILAFNPLLWFTLAIYVLMRTAARSYVPEVLSNATSDSMTILGGFLSFFLVFYVNQNHKRFFSLYQDSMGVKGRIFDLASLAVTTLPFAQANRLVRYCNAAHAASYVGLSEIYPSGSYFNHVDNTLGLLTDEERARMNAIDLDKGGSCSRELIVWAMNEIQSARTKGILDPELAAQFRDQILQLRGKLGQAYNAKDLPIPFFYVHFICLLTTLYLPLFAVTSAIEAGTGEDTHWSAGLIKGLVVLLQSIFVIGLRVLGQKMSDPFGDDLIDLSVMHYVNFTWTHSNRILHAHFPEEASVSVENHLIAQRDSVGKAFEPEKHESSVDGEATETASRTSMMVDRDFVPNSVILNPRLDHRQLSA